jgi:hypothetical protein
MAASQQFALHQPLMFIGLAALRPCNRSKQPRPTLVTKTPVMQSIFIPPVCLTQVSIASHLACLLPKGK